ncbi:DUF4169 family protein [Actibacterium lipolyticum]|uniref:DUF4169 domain-containing protein n=1 Tax=Actibacterium lipolyticum TaxID=1524263 RepID=A0A238JY73_9RHOB|nr:DUF4169 family protein [Actibacterium lipolyticum]SMX34656.1 hypothetical protein COL8621_01421 [Actibacterium lipolyticum]
MPKIINLKSARKARERDQKRATGDENSVKFGRTKAVKTLESARNEKARSDLEKHRRDDT